MISQLRRLLRRDDGSASIEAAILAVPLGALIVLAIIGGRIQVAGGTVQAAAHDAARTASISRTAADAQSAARAAARATLDQANLHCSSLTVSVNTAGFAIPVGRPATVSATVTCVVDFRDLIANGIPGSHTVTSTFVSDLDTFRTRT